MSYFQDSTASLHTYLVLPIVAIHYLGDVPGGGGGDMNSSLLSRRDKKLQNSCIRNRLTSLQYGVSTFYHVSMVKNGGRNRLHVYSVKLKKKKKPLAKTVRVENYTVSNTSDITLTIRRVVRT